MDDPSALVGAMNSAYLLDHPEMLKKLLSKRRAARRKLPTVIVLSIKPKYAKAIYEGRKNWEFRKAPPPCFRDMYVYESAPVSAITGTISFCESVTGIPLAVFEIVRTNKCYTRNLPGITYAELVAYAGPKLVTAMRVLDAKRFDKPVEFKPRPPQNWGRFLLRSSGGAE